MDRGAFQLRLSCLRIFESHQDAQQTELFKALICPDSCLILARHRTTAMRSKIQAHWRWHRLWQAIGEAAVGGVGEALAHFGGKVKRCSQRCKTSEL